MGFFSKLKENFKHGGIKIGLDIPSHVPATNPSLTAKVTLTNTESVDHTINTVYVRLVRDESINAAGQPTNTTETAGQNQIELAGGGVNEPFVLKPGESKTLSVDVTSSTEALNKAADSSNSVVAAAAKFLGNVNALTGGNYRHFVQATVKIEGISFSASTSQDISVLRPGEFGGTKSVKL